MVNGTLLNFGKRYEDTLRVIFDQRQKLHFGLDALSNQKILKGIYCLCTLLGFAIFLPVLPPLISQLNKTDEKVVSFVHI